MFFKSLIPHELCQVMMLNLFLQAFTGQCQVTPSTAWSKACSLQWWVMAHWSNHLHKQAVHTVDTIFMHSWRSSKQAPILTKDILSKMAWSEAGTSATAMMTGVYWKWYFSKWKSIFSRTKSQKCAKRKIKRSIENNLNTKTWVNRSTYLKTAEKPLFIFKHN